MNDNMVKKEEELSKAVKVDLQMMPCVRLLWKHL